MRLTRFDTGATAWSSSTSDRSSVAVLSASSLPTASTVAMSAGLTTYPGTACRRDSFGGRGVSSAATLAALVAFSRNVVRRSPRGMHDALLDSTGPCMRWPCIAAAKRGLDWPTDSECLSAGIRYCEFCAGRRWNPARRRACWASTTGPFAAATAVGQFSVISSVIACRTCCRTVWPDRLQTG